MPSAPQRPCAGNLTTKTVRFCSYTNVRLVNAEGSGLLSLEHECVLGGVHAVYCYAAFIIFIQTLHFFVQISEKYDDFYSLFS
jgi:hypothetical protein